MTELALERDDFDLQACRSLMRGGSKTFFAASLLLPPRVRLSATALYAFCRVADDAIDEGHDKHAAMRDLQARLDAVYEAQPRQLDADLALAVVVHQHRIPRALLDALLEGFYWDAQGRRYESIEDLHAYAARVAAAVGAMMAVIMGARSEAALSRACDLGAAMQLTNIARDVGEDARAGRLYLPLQWMRQAGLDPENWLRQPVFNEAVAQVVARLLAEADRLYDRAEAGIAMLPRDCQPAIRAAGMVYAEIGREVERRGMNSVDSRAVVSSSRKLMLIGKALGWPHKARNRAQSSAPALPANEFLVTAAAHHRRHDVQTGPTRVQADEAGRVGWMIDLFERREQMRRQGHRLSA